MITRGIFQGCFPGDWPMARCVALAGELAFDGFEVVMEDDAPLLPEALDETTEDVLAIGRSVGVTALREGALTLGASPEALADLTTLAREAGVRVHSVATMLLFYYPLSSPVRVVREKGIQVVLEMLRAAAGIGAETALIQAGMVTPGVGYLEAYERSRSVIRDLATEAERVGVVLAIENVWSRFLLSPLEFARYLDEIGSSYVGAYVDVANVLTFGYPDDWLRILGPRVRGVHFKDFRREIDNILGFTHLLHGDVPWNAVMAALHDIQYDGAVTVEAPPLRTCPEEGLRQARAALELILGAC